MNKGLALGCSHTAGVGVDYSDCYVTLLSCHYQTTIKNLAVPGGSYEQVESNLINDIKNDRPDFVIAQWPNPFRCTIWNGESPNFENTTNASLVFRQLLKLGEKNFYTLWIQSIITCNTVCAVAKVPIVNIMLENLEEQYYLKLKKEGIVLHMNENFPGKTWLHDNAANDNMHHSAQCHRAWADRLIGLIDEITT